MRQSCGGVGDCNGRLSAHSTVVSSVWQSGQKLQFRHTLPDMLGILIAVAAHHKVLYYQLVCSLQGCGFDYLLIYSDFMHQTKWFVLLKYPFPLWCFLPIVMRLLSWLLSVKMIAQANDCNLYAHNEPSKNNAQVSSKYVFNKNHNVRIWRGIKYIHLHANEIKKYLEDPVPIYTHPNLGQPMM